MSYSSEVLADSPVAYWRLGESSGTSAADATGNGNTGTYTNSPTLGVAGIVGGGGDTAATFDRTSPQYVTASVVSTATNNFTIECWVRTASLSFDVNPELYVMNGDDTAGWGIGRGDGGGSGIGGVNLVALFGGVAWLTTSYDFADTNWHHVVFQRDAGTAKAYVDSSVITVNSSASVPGTPTGVTTIAAEFKSGTYQRGASATIDEVAIYNSVLSAGRVGAHYSAGTAPPGTTPTWGVLTGARLG